MVSKHTPDVEPPARKARNGGNLWVSNIRDKLCISDQLGEQCLLGLDELSNPVERLADPARRCGFHQFARRKAGFRGVGL